MSEIEASSIKHQARPRSAKIVAPQRNLGEERVLPLPSVAAQEITKSRPVPFRVVALEACAIWSTRFVNAPGEDRNYLRTACGSACSGTNPTSSSWGCKTSSGKPSLSQRPTAQLDRAEAKHQYGWSLSERPREFCQKFGAAQMRGPAKKLRSILQFRNAPRWSTYHHVLPTLATSWKLKARYKITTTSDPT